MGAAEISDLWWKHAVIYCADIETFLDSDGDGIGDIAGMTSQLDYLAELGITCLWLMPFHPHAQQGRRLRHRGLLRRGRAPREPGRPRRPHPHRPRPRHPGDRRPRRQPHLRPASVVPRVPLQHRQPVPRLLRLALHEAAGHLGHGRLPQRGGLHLVAGRGHRALVPAPLLPAPARSQHRQPAGPGRDRQDHGLLVAARSGRLPRRRGAPALHGRPARPDREQARPARSPRVSAGPAPLRAPAQRPVRAAGRGESALRGAAVPLRRPGRRGVDHGLRLRGHAAPAPVAGAGGRDLPGRLPSRPAGDPARQPVGDVRAQPRRAGPGPAQRVRAAGDLRRVRPRGADAALRTGSAPPPADDARRRPAAAAHGLLAAVLPSRLPRALLRRGDRHG